MKKRKRTIFWKIYIGFTAAALVGIGVLWVVLWRFMAAYEQSQPEYLVEQVVEAFASGDTDYVLQFVDTAPSAFETAETLKQQAADKLGEGNWEYIRKAGDYSKDAPVFQLKKDGEKAAVIYLKQQSARGSFNTPRWELDQITDLIDSGDNYRITVPAGSSVTVNGTVLDAQYITADGLACENLGNVAKYIEAPKMTCYTIKGLWEEPEICVVGPVYQTALTCQENTQEQDTEGVSYQTYVYGFECDEDFAAAQESRIMEITKLYGNYVTNDAGFGSLSPYILRDSYAYEYLQKVAQTNKWYAAHTSTEFRDLKVFGYQIFTADCFSCEVTFHHVVHTQSQDFSYPTHIQYIFVNKENVWYVADLSLKVTE